MSQPTDQTPYQPQPPVSPPPYGYATPPPAPAPKTTRKDFWLRGPGIIVLIVVVGLIVAGPLLIWQALSERAAADDITVSTTYCNMGDLTLRSAKVGLQVRNDGDQARTVRVEIEYRDARGNRIDTDTATIRNVPANDTVAYEETTLLDAPSGGTGTCTIVSVS